MAQEGGLPLGCTSMLEGSRGWSLGGIEVAQERGLPLECNSMLEGSWGWSLGGIEVAQEGGLPLGHVYLAPCCTINKRVAEGERISSEFD